VRAAPVEARLGRGRLWPARNHRRPCLRSQGVRTHAQGQIGHARDKRRHTNPDTDCRPWAATPRERSSESENCRSYPYCKQRRLDGVQGGISDSKVTASPCAAPRDHQTVQLYEDPPSGRECKVKKHPRQRPECGPEALPCSSCNLHCDDSSRDATRYRFRHIQCADEKATARGCRVCCTDR